MTTVVEVQKVTWPRTVRVQGSLLARERVMVSAKVPGRVKDVRVDLGSVVAAGEVVASLEPEEFDLRVRQAESQVEQVRATLGLRRDEEEAAFQPEEAPAVRQEAAVLRQAEDSLKRATGLKSARAISAEEFERCEADVKVAQARFEAALHRVHESLALLGVRRVELALARQAQADSLIRAPFEGIVEQRHVAPGAYVQVGAPVALLVSMDPLRFRAGVPERYVTALRLGEAASVRIEGEPAPLPAKITRISPSLDLASRALSIEADLPNPGLRLRAGLFAEAEIVVEPEAQAIVVPAGEIVRDAQGQQWTLEGAVREFAGVEKVRLVGGGELIQNESQALQGERNQWEVKTVRGGEVVERKVATGRRDDRWVEVTTHLKPGDRVEVKLRAEAGAAAGNGKS